MPSAIAGLAGSTDLIEVPGNGSQLEFMAVRGLPIAVSTADLLAQGQATIRQLRADQWRQQDGTGEDQVTVDVDADRVVLRRDALGVRPLYYAVSPDRSRLAWASRPTQLAAISWVDSSPDWDTILDVLSGVPRADPRRSCVLGIRQVSPGHHLEWRPGQITEIRDWNPTDYLWNGAPAVTDAVARFAELLQVALKRRVDRPSALFLSGGIDSPVLAAAAVRLGLPVEGLSVIYPRFPSADESRNIRAVLDALGLSGELLHGNRHVTFDVEAELALHGEPHGGTSYATYRRLLQAASERGFSLAIDGCDGDSALGYLDGIGRYVLARPALGLACWRYLRTSGIAASLLAQAWLQELVPSAFGYVNRLRRQWRPPQAKPENRPLLQSWGSQLLAHQRAIIGRRQSWKETQLLAASPFLAEALVLMGRVADDCGIDVVHPFADRTLIEFLLAQPPEVKHIGGQWKGLARAAFPELPAAVRRSVHKVDITAAVEAQYPLAQLVPLLVDPPVPVPVVDYDALRKRLVSGAPYEPGELHHLRTLALVHRFLEQRYPLVSHAR